IAARPDGSPDCTVNPAIDKNDSAFRFASIDCAGSACIAVRAIVVAFDNVDTIPDGSVLYSCEVEIAADVPDGVYTIGVSGVVLSTSRGYRVYGAGGVDGCISVGQPLLPDA